VINPLWPIDPLNMGIQFLCRNLLKVFLYLLEIFIFVLTSNPNLDINPFFTLMNFCGQCKAAFSNPICYPILRIRFPGFQL